MRSIGQGDVLVENAQILQCELMDCYEKSEEEKARPLLEALEEVFRKDTPGIEELLEQTTLYLYTPCLVCGTLSQRCHDLSVAILEIMSQNGPAREVFTGKIQPRKVPMDITFGCCRMDRWSVVAFGEEQCR